MNERGRTMCLNVCTVTRALVRISLSFVKHIASGPLTTHQVATQSVQPFPSYGKGCACAHAHLYPTINLCKNAKLMDLWPQIKFQRNPSSRFRDPKRGATCSCAPLLTSVKSLANGSLTTYRISAQSVQPFSRCRKGGTSPRVHVQMYPTHYLCNMQYALQLGLLTLALMGGVESPLRVFEDSEKTAARSAAVFCIPYQPSFSHLS